MSPPNADLAIPAQPIPFRYPMRRLADRLGGTGAIKIVALGSSTTAGEGGIVPYPQRLESALRAWRSPRHFDVLNRGIGGQEAPDEVARLQRDVLDEHPAVVIWQVGTNAVWHRLELDTVAQAIRRGLALLESADADEVLMDAQYLPALLTPDRRDAALRVESLIVEAAESAGYPVNLFRRFDLMRRWHQAERVSFDRMVDPEDSDRLHQSDWSTRRIAETLASMMLAAAETKA